jgi:hypothetical protein
MIHGFHKKKAASRARILRSAARRGNSAPDSRSHVRRVRGKPAWLRAAAMTAPPAGPAPMQAGKEGHLAWPRRTIHRRANSVVGS